MAACAAGEDTIVTSDKGNYAANVEKAEIGERAWTFDAAPTMTLLAAQASCRLLAWPRV